VERAVAAWAQHSTSGNRSPITGATPSAGVKYSPSMIARGRHRGWRSDHPLTSAVLKAYLTGLRVGRAAFLSAADGLPGRSGGAAHLLVLEVLAPGTRAATWTGRRFPAGGFRTSLVHGPRRAVRRSAEALKNRCRCPETPGPLPDLLAGRNRHDHGASGGFGRALSPPARARARASSWWARNGGETSIGSTTRSRRSPGAAAIARCSICDRDGHRVRPSGGTVGKEFAARRTGACGALLAIAPRWSIDVPTCAGIAVI